MSIASACIVLGGLAMLLDLGNRLFGSYARTGAGAAARIVLIVALWFLLTTPLFLLAVDPESAVARALRVPFSLCAAAIFIHVLLPYRWGIRRLPSVNSRDDVRVLAEGVVLRDTTVDVPIRLDDLDSIVCLVISDVHCDRDRHLARIRQSLERVECQGADFVFLLGDFGVKPRFLPVVFELLGSLPSRFGTFCVRGNHDFEGGRQGIIEELARREGMVLLANKIHRVLDTELALIGLESPWSRAPHPHREDCGLAIGLSHTPDNIGAFSRLGAAVAVAGHTHGGRCRLPVLGPMLVPSRYGRFLNKGWFNLGRCLLCITSGIEYQARMPGGTGEIVRLNIRLTGTKEESS